jgi:Palmitoyl protein thioesterase
MQGVSKLVYLPVVKDHVIQAQYFKAPLELQHYLASNPFLPDLNNEHDNHIKEQYRENLKQLDSFALVRFHDDMTGTPYLLLICPCFAPLALCAWRSRTPWNRCKLHCKGTQTAEGDFNAAFCISGARCEHAA